MNRLFITGTDTGVGKTAVTAALARWLRARGLRVGVMKPVASGARRTPAGLTAEDTEELLAAVGAPAALPPALVTPYVYEPPVSPSVAARLAGRPVLIEVVAEGYRAVCARSDAVLVEGVGGAMVPLGVGARDAARFASGGRRDATVADLIAALDLPALIVARDALGAINHTLLTLDHLARRGVAVVGVLFNRLSSDDVDACANGEEVARVAGVRVWGPLPYAPVQQERERAWHNGLQPLCNELFADVAAL